VLAKAMLTFEKLPIDKAKEYKPFACAVHSTHFIVQRHIYAEQGRTVLLRRSSITKMRPLLIHIYIKLPVVV
jgi:hypothetical protein